LRKPALSHDVAFLRGFFALGGISFVRNDRGNHVTKFRAYLAVQNDTNLVIDTAAGKAIWATGTFGD
jgi:hypothetical protein